MIALAIAIFLAAALSAATGMAGGILMLLAMNTVIPLRPLVAIHGAVQIFNNATQGWLLRQAIKPSMCLWFALGAILGATSTTLLLVHLIPDYLPLLLLGSMTLYALLRPQVMPALRLSDRNHLWLGLAAGTVGILVGAVDPLLGAFFLREDLSKEQIVANKATMQLVTHLTKVPAYGFLGFAFLDHLGLITVFATAAMLGARGGVFLLRCLGGELFLLLMKLALWVVTLRVLYQLAISLTHN